MIHELRLYEFHPGALVRYLPLAGGVALQIRGPELGRLIGFWLARRGETDVAVHLWSYDSLDHRQQARESLVSNPRWNNEFLVHILPMLKSQEVRFLAPVGESRVSPSSSSVYQLQTFNVPPGALAPALEAAKSLLCAGTCQLYAGIAPWPNSFSVLSAAPTPAHRPSQVRGASLVEHIDMTPSYFSPMQ